MEIAGGYLAQKVRSCPPVSSVPSGHTGILPGRGLSMRSFPTTPIAFPRSPQFTLRPYSGLQKSEVAPQSIRHANSVLWPN